MITLQIDIDKIDKSRFKTIPTKKGQIRVLELVLVETPNNQFGNDYFVTQSTSKEEREAKVRLPILGNAKILQRGSRTAVSKPQSAEDWL